MKSKGFTLIELLVVIAIIGILASVVLVSFPGAKKRANDSRVISAISQMRTVMTYYESNQGSYTGFSRTSEDMATLVAEAEANDATAAPGTMTIVVNGTTPSPSGSACLAAALNATSGQYYCADSTGKAGRTTGVSGVICQAAGAAICLGTLSD